MDANVLKLIGTVVAAGLAILGHLHIVPIDSEISTSIATLLAGWLHLPQPGTAKKPVVRGFEP